ncbi:MAG: choice-of-anchor Q domain-containing protein [Verrucomicrobiota bacterium]
MRTWHSFLSAKFWLLAILGLLPLTVRSGVVSTCDEAGLRAAIAGGGLVTFSCDGTIALTNTITITNTVILDGTGHNVIISGSNVVRIFSVNSGMSLTLRKLTLVDGYARGINGSGGVGEGGSILNNGGILSAIDCVFQRNKAMGGTGSTGGMGGIGRGGAICNLNGQVGITNCQLALNIAFGGIAGPPSNPINLNGADALGGAIYTSGGFFQMVNCIISSNNVTPGRGYRLGVSPSWYTGIAFGGAIYNAGGIVNLIGGIISSNTCQTEFLASANGGAIYQSGGNLNITDTLFQLNRAQGGTGLGVGTANGIAGGSASGGCVFISVGMARITNSTFTKNLALGGERGTASKAGPSYGGTIYNLGTLELINCTLNTNMAQAGDSISGEKASGYGGGLYNAGGNSTLTHVTIAENSAKLSIGTAPNFGAVAQGGGIFSANGTVTLQNTILAYNFSGSNCFGAAFTDSGNNISSDGSCNFFAPGSLTNTDPILGPLGNYGGTTPTMPLLAGSPAIDGGNNSFCTTTDQRGVARPFGAGCDIGAFESSPPYTIRGRILGYISAADMTVTANSPSAVSSDGSYALNGFNTGNYLVVPSASDAIFVASNQTVNVGPDVLNVNFYSYRSNAFAIFRLTNNVQNLVFAGAKGKIFEVQTSTNLVNWSPYSTNTIEANGLFQLFRTNSFGNQVEFFRSKEL